MTPASDAGQRAETHRGIARLVVVEADRPEDAVGDLHAERDEPAQRPGPLRGPQHPESLLLTRLLGLAALRRGGPALPGLLGGLTLALTRLADLLRLGKVPADPAR